MELELRPDTIDLLPVTDCTLVLSLWHHLVREQGLDTPHTCSGSSGPGPAR